MTTKTKAALPVPDVTASAPDVDLLEDRPRWQREDWLPELKRVRWPRLEHARKRHLAAVGELRAALEAGNQAAEDTAITAIGDVVLEVAPHLRAAYAAEAEDARREAGEAVEPKAKPIADGSLPIAPVAATPEGDRTDAREVANQRAEEFDERWRAEVADLAEARAEFEADVEALRYQVWTRLEPVLMVRDSVVCVDVREVEKLREAPPEPSVAALEGRRG